MDVVVIGAGVGGLLGAMLLADDGHQVTVLERDPAEPPADPEQAWNDWARTGVNQFRMVHFFLPRFRELLEAELPTVAEAVDRAGAARHNVLSEIPDELTGGLRPGDERHVALTARRPVMEAAIAGCAAAAGIEVRRGVGVASLLTGAPAAAGIPHVIGVQLEGGEELAADIVIDASGRRSPLPRWLEAMGARAPIEELDDSGFVYYGRHYRSADGSTPPPFCAALAPFGSISMLTLPADHGTWGVGIVASAKDKPMRGVRDVERWEAVVRSLPLVAHWIDAEPLDDSVAVMAKIEDRYRRFVVDGQPVATGVLAVADAWACTNTSVGRGATIGLMHSVVLRDLLREGPIEDPLALGLEWDRVTAETVEPWFRATVDFDRHRLADIEAQIAGEVYEPGDPGWEMLQAMQAGAGKDPDVLRGFLDIAGLLATSDQVMARPGLFERVIAAGAGWRDEPVLAPARAELAALAAG